MQDPVCSCVCIAVCVHCVVRADGYDVCVWHCRQLFVGRDSASGPLVEDVGHQVPTDGARGRRPGVPAPRGRCHHAADLLRLRETAAHVRRQRSADHTVRKRYLLSPLRRLCHPLRLFICWFVSRITQKVTAGSGWNCRGRLNSAQLKGD